MKLLHQRIEAANYRFFCMAKGKALFNYLMENGVITDWREPNVIRLAPAPFYCSYEDMYRFGQILKQGIFLSKHTVLVLKNTCFLTDHQLKK